MSNANPIQPYGYGTDQRDEFERKGHPGRFHRSITCTSGVTVFTGSNFGVGGVIVTNGTVGTASFSNGGIMPLAALTASNSDLYEFSLFSVKVDSGIVYALVRNQLIR